MKEKKKVLRTCVVSRERLEKNNLIRIVRTPAEGVKIDLTGKMNGRGAYLKKDKTVLEKAKKSKVLERHLDSSIDNEIYEELERIISNEGE